MAFFKLPSSFESAKNAFRQMIRTDSNNTFTDAFFFHMHNGLVEVLELTAETKELFDSHEISLSMNQQSVSVTARHFLPGHAMWLNGSLLSPGKETTLVNGDVLTLQSLRWEDSEFFLFSVMNQKDTAWTFCDVPDSPDFSSDYMPDTYAAKRNDDRHLLNDGLHYYLQQELAPAHHATLPLLAKQLDDDTHLSIDINGRYANSGANRKKLLEDIRLELKPQEMVLILGGSGAGKTTFFDTVMGTEKGDATILIGDRDLYKNYEKMKQMIGYVRQNNVLRLTDTVYKTLESIACTRLPKVLSQDKVLLDRLIMDTLKQLSIENEVDNLVTKLSGGQLRRLNIAAEYISAPPLFFLDEPDSGLDPLIAKTLMHSLREIADKGKIVIVITHTADRTPELFDKVLVLAKSKDDECGKMAYFGTPDGMRDFFSKHGINSIISTEKPASQITFEDVVHAIETEPDHFINAYAKEYLNHE